MISPNITVKQGYTKCSICVTSKNSCITSDRGIDKILKGNGINSALLFSAISLIMLAYTNRFLSYAQLVRTLKDQYRENHSAVTAAQIANLRKRLYLTRAMQVTGIGSLLLCVVSMFLMYIQFYLISVYIFGLALVLLIISLGISVREIYISVKALELHLSDMDS